ncbi:MAG TPA: YfhO family protein, partial [Thermoanaerobaculia bacterium]|nr:YfhO family protein [Thermoanaerobaculia bacterium]
TLLLFCAIAIAIVVLWNRTYRRVPWLVAIAFLALTIAYQAPTLFTSRVDLPGRLAYVAYPWKALGGEPVKANTGIVFTQLAPWTRIARDELKSGAMPLWNRYSAGGAPLLANQQTALFHPFTLLGLPLSIGKAFTLSASLRLFTLLFFTFVFLRGFELLDAASLFGAVAYAFCTFHIVWLLFPLGLATMMLPVALTGARELVETRTAPAYVLLTLGLALSVLGGHPESALWVWITTAAFIVYFGRTRVVLPATAFIIAALLTAFFWYPTLTALETTERFQKFQRRELNPADHGLSYEWLLTLVAPNVLGNPVSGTYTPPRGRHAAVLNDYGEVASSYAGLLTLALAFSAPFVSRRRPLFFALGMMLFALLTIAEAPLWRDLIRAVPLAGVSLHQRLRVLWDLGVCIAAAVALDRAGRAEARPTFVSLVLCGAMFLGVYVVHTPRLDALGVVQLVVPIGALIVFAIQPRLAIPLLFVDLAAATWRYNPPAQPGHVYPLTGAIDFMQRAAKPYRVAAWGWSLMPDTPGYYGLEDIKTTDPVQHFGYMFLLRGYLGIDPSSPELVVSNVERAYVDFLNVRFLYVPPDNETHPAGFVERYRGPDGVVLENVEVLPRYFFVAEASEERDLGMTVAKSRVITDYRAQAIVERKPPHVPERFRGGSVHVRRYEGQRTELDVESRGWNLLVTSDTHWPGWHARVNGRETEVVKVNGAFNGVYIPPGQAKVELWYWPEEVTYGLIAGVVGLLLLAFVTSRT